MSETGGELTPEFLSRALDELWNGPPRPAPGYDFSREDWKPAVCGTALFPLFDPPYSADPAGALVRAMAREGIPIHPGDIVHLGPVQGPTPAYCLLEPHPDGTWHWDGVAAWWR